MIFEATPELKQALINVWNAIGHDMPRDDIESNRDVIELCIDGGCFEACAGDDAEQMHLELRRLFAAYGINAVYDTLAAQVQLW
jgi:hypothetical protein